MLIHNYLYDASWLKLNGCLVMSIYQIIQYHSNPYSNFNLLEVVTHESKYKGELRTYKKICNILIEGGYINQRGEIDLSQWKQINEVLQSRIFGIDFVKRIRVNSKDMILKFLHNKGNHYLAVLTNNNKIIRVFPSNSQIKNMHFEKAYVFS